MKKMTYYKYWWLILFIVCVFSSCMKEDSSPYPDTFAFVFDFEDGTQGWIGGFADLPVDGQDIYELDVSHSALPEETGVDGNAVRVQGHNRSDDLFMFLKRQLTDLVPSTTYNVVFELELASKYPEESMGVGGSPGGSVYLKAGVTEEEPEALPGGNEASDFLGMNIDKGNQSEDGADMFGLGTIGIEGEEFRYELISRDNADRPFTVTTGPDGSVWLIVGTDSGFEGLTALYYNRITVTFVEVN